MLHLVFPSEKSVERSNHTINRRRVLGEESGIATGAIGEFGCVGWGGGREEEERWAVLCCVGYIYAPLVVSGSMLEVKEQREMAVESRQMQSEKRVMPQCQGSARGSTRTI